MRQDLTALIKERKPVDPEKERQMRHEAAVKKFVGAITSFNKDMETLKLIPHNIVEEAKALLKKLEANIKD